MASHGTRRQPSSARPLLLRLDGSRSLPGHHRDLSLPSLLTSSSGPRGHGPGACEACSDILGALSGPAPVLTSAYLSKLGKAIHGAHLSSQLARIVSQWEGKTVHGRFS